MRNKGHVFGVQTFTDSKNTLSGTCPEIKGTLNWCIFRKMKEQVYHCFFFLFFFGGGGGDYFPRSRFIKAVISIHMYIVRASICHP